MFYLTRHDGGETLYLHNWDRRRSAWSPDAAGAYIFPTVLDALDIAALCGGGVDDRQHPQITIVEA